MLQETFNWDKLSLIAGLTLRQFYFRIYEGSIKGPQAADFLRKLLVCVPGKLLVIWDGAAIHRSQPVKPSSPSPDSRLWLARPRRTPLNLTRSNTCGLTSKNTRSPTFLARNAWDLSCHLQRCAARAAVHGLSGPAGNKLNFAYSVSLLCEPQ